MRQQVMIPARAVRAMVPRRSRSMRQLTRSHHNLMLGRWNAQQAAMSRLIQQQQQMHRRRNRRSRRRR